MSKSICTGATIRDSMSRLDRLLNHVTVHEAIWKAYPDAILVPVVRWILR